MTRLPLIVGFGGIGPAGRSSFHHAYKRMIFESLPNAAYQDTFLGLATMMNLVTFDKGLYVDKQGCEYTSEQVVEVFKTEILEGTLVRRIEIEHFNSDALHWHKKLPLQAEKESKLSFTTFEKHLPQPLPANWHITQIENNEAHSVKVTITGETELLTDSYRAICSQAAGQLPTGFKPEEQYNARAHPRGLQMAIIAASDAIHSTGIDWSVIANTIKPDEVAVYAGSVMSQMDDNSNGGLMKSRLLGQRVSSKHLALGLNTMPADFINAYVLGSVGSTGSTTGACATFLYNLRHGIEDIQSGRCRVAIIGNSEAPLTPEIFDGYGAMGALATNEKLAQIQGLKPNEQDKINHRLASRPFGDNCGFTLAESAQYIVLMDDALALQLGANIHGAVSDVFINSDGPKKSISAPGPGNYITLAKAVSSAVSLVGLEAVKNKSLVMAHGSSTPQNRVTESRLLDKIAETFEIKKWPICAVKSYLGHSLSPASADQLFTALGVFKHGIIPGIKTITDIADDVVSDRLLICTRDMQLSPGNIDIAFLNSKGFGGNNASACILSPDLVYKMLNKRYGESQLAQLLSNQSKSKVRADNYDKQATQGDLQTIYKFGENMLDEDKISLDMTAIKLPGFKQEIILSTVSKYADML